MTLEQLRIFVAVAERQHQTEAARVLNLTQSAVSGAIAALEARYDTKLFHRVGRGIALTAEGTRFLAEARAVLARAAAAEQVLDDMSGLKHGHLTIEASQTVGGFWLPRYLMDFRALYPAIGVVCGISNTERAATCVREGTADLAFVEGTVDDPSLKSEIIGRDQLLLVVGVNHPWAKRRKIDAADLSRTSWVLREKGSGTRAMLEAALARLRIKPASLNVELELSSNAAVRSAVIASSAATVLSASVVAAGLEAGLLHAVKMDLPEREFSVVTHKERYLSRPAAALLALIAKKPRSLSV
jgi:DNA-binding transcriptional LysR family regulator